MFSVIFVIRYLNLKQLIRVKMNRYHFKLSKVIGVEVGVFFEFIEPGQYLARGLLKTSLARVLFYGGHVYRSKIYRCQFKTMNFSKKDKTFTLLLKLTKA